jgi:hypothetical protein
MFLCYSRTNLDFNWNIFWSSQFAAARTWLAAKDSSGVHQLLGTTQWYHHPTAAASC